MGEARNGRIGPNVNYAPQYAPQLYLTSLMFVIQLFKS
jgi:hypothetical protein